MNQAQPLKEKTEKELSKVPEASKPGEVYKKDFYAAMDKKYPGLTQAKVRVMKQDEYEQLQDDLGKYAIKMGVPENDAADYADAYLGIHLPNDSTTRKFDESKPTEKATPDPKPVIKQPASKKQDKCTAEELSTAQLLAKVMKFVEQNTIVWNDIFSSKKWKKSQEIEGIYEMKGDNAGKVIVKIRDWSTKAKKDQVKWYILCIDSFKLTKIEAPGQNTYKRIISKRQLQAAYTTKGEHKYKRCANLYSEMAKCRAKGNCTTEQKERYSKRIGTCGNLGKRKVAVPTFIKYLHAETRKRRKVGESYGEALSRVAGEVKTLE